MPTNPRSGLRRSDKRAAHGAVAAAGRRAGFSLLELVVVLAVTLLLTSMMLPALSHVRENLNRVVCASNLRQQGYAYAMYARDENDDLPFSYELAEHERPEGLTIARLEDRGPFDDMDGWDGQGLLYRQGYCDAADCFYCPSHLGARTPDRYDWQRLDPEPRDIETNYHYSGHIDWLDTRRKRQLHEHRLVLAVDALPELDGLNHEMGMNVLRGDGSVVWDEQGPQQVWLSIQRHSGSSVGDGYRHLWRLIEEPDHGFER